MSKINKVFKIIKETEVLIIEVVVEDVTKAEEAIRIMVIVQLVRYAQSMDMLLHIATTDLITAIWDPHIVLEVNLHKTFTTRGHFNQIISKKRFSWCY
ncbi:hypothetical protein Syun_013827 [Stephania yunnanensis]|uniref:Uncharacterized protein n=1 Tax=Stephania yunnanensis TaxID=152371 RepID=A0AAP0P810_9MAGN